MIITLLKFPVFLLVCVLGLISEVLSMISILLDTITESLEYFIDY
jgi:hypothetical protein